MRFCFLHHKPALLKREEKPMGSSAMKKYGAEALGTFVLTLFGCGSAVIAGATLGTMHR